MKNKKAKWILVSILVLLGLVFLGWFGYKVIYYLNYEEITVSSEVNHAMESKTKIKQMAANQKSKAYLLKNCGKTIQKMTDNQGSGNVLYYSGFIGKKTVGINGKLSHANATFPTYKVTKLYLN